tara:strand:- start:2136 stop:2540 length:405 start_codon:yes stop_codon:yes gene_type:complete
MTPAFYALGLYAGLLGLIAMWLFGNVGSVKNKAKIFMGDGGDARVIRAMRGQANFVENVPMILILLVIGASLNMPAIAIHIIGIALVVGRFFHALHFTKADAPGWQRKAGAMLTFFSLAGASLSLIGHALISMF